MWERLFSNYYYIKNTLRCKNVTCTYICNTYVIYKYYYQRTLLLTGPGVSCLTHPGVLRNSQKHTSKWEFYKLLLLAVYLKCIVVTTQVVTTRCAQN